MCLNRPKKKNGAFKTGFITVRESTTKSKYEFINLYYTKWNDITKPSPRIIVDTHAGTGQVVLIKESPLLRTVEKEVIYGSALLAILKTLLISDNLVIILNEASKKNYLLLEKCKKAVVRRGLPIFEEIQERVRFRSLKTNRPNLKRRKKKRKFPNSFNSKTPRGFQRVWIKSKADILLKRNKIENSIDDLFSEYINIIDERTNKMPKSLFLVDPCGMVSWNKVILKICKRSNKLEGTELILNWSWEVIARNLNTQSKNSTLSEIYGIPLENIDEEFQDLGLDNMQEFKNIYIQQLEAYFKHVVEVGVPKDRQLRPKQSQYRKYFLIFCTNNKSALSLAGYQLERIEQNVRGNIRKINYYFQ